ncbi:helix-turn-helix domain-containing protein [Clostridium botulinum]|uniref:helix-turn-helix domain-containing protein n=1 Tax=Clostridium botulinum TaxID=1491 RepID=UPI00016B9D04|nr:helix-turn-helix transcriptional regulator [Clostridium botulinum]NEZ88438.1 XRE family transcriptional regulator [Clostridium botulinum]WCJ75385.1 helix-turn-helix transcriptional regulator [Clostridium botulinum]WCJ79224.1 helix-turn-helix transcriptional regulator [Clostridium botulinum]WCJ83050.1 helix-turn-helix transcriptional regulator [Clostridium botulinum]
MEQINNVNKDNKIKSYRFALEKIRSENKMRRIEAETISERRLSMGIKANIQSKYKLNIEKYRIQKGYSIAELSKKTSISWAYISYLCNGTHENPSLEKLVKIAKVLECSLDKLVEF